MRELPSGTVTFLFTDIEGSTRLLLAAGDAYAELLDIHRRIVREALSAHDGHELGTEGDSFGIAFARASDGFQAAFDAQRALCAHPWPDSHAVRVRMGLHTGEVSVVSGDYVGLAIHQAARISAAAHGGQVILSSTVANLVRDALPADVGLRDLGEYALKDIERPQSLYQLTHRDLPDDFPTPTSFRALPNNLPAQLTSFVGRDDDLVEARRLLDATRLLTITGAGGAGKTRLAVELAAEVIRDYPDGAWLVDFAPVAEPDLVAQMTAVVLGLRDESSTAQRTWEERLVEFIADRSLLLLLDNCEHLVGACADLVESILRSCRQIRIVATTREPLGVDGETAWRVPSLSLPDEDMALEDLIGCGAIQLFRERARDVETAFELAASNATDVAEICRHLDGIPLAIELAAARTQVLSPRQILERLDDRFRLLRGSGRRRIERQQTLRAAVDWSYELLGEDERELLRRLSVFAGGFSLEAAEAVCAGGTISAEDVLELLDSLVRKSLAVAEPKSGTLRYRLLETIRQYALEKLLDSGEGPKVRTRHRDYFVAFAEVVWTDMKSLRDEEGALDRAQIDIDNLRTAMEWAPAGDDGTAAVQIAGALQGFWVLRGSMSEARARIDQALQRQTGTAASIRARALGAASGFAFHLGDIAEVDRLASEVIAMYPDGESPLQDAAYHAESLVAAAMVAYFRDSDLARAQALCEEAVAVGRRAGDVMAIGQSLFNLGALLRFGGDLAGSESALSEAVSLSPTSIFVSGALASLSITALHRGEIDRARRLADESLVGARKTRGDWALINALTALCAVALEQGNLLLARSTSEEWLAAGRQAGDKLQGVALALSHRATALALDGDLDAAADCLEESIPITDEVSATVESATARQALAEIHEARGDLDGARDLYARALAGFREVLFAHGIAACLEGQAAIAASDGRHEEAAALLGEAEESRRTAGPAGWDSWKGLALPAREEWFARMREELARRV